MRSGDFTVVRMVGALLLAGAGLWAGLERGRVQARRIRALREWSEALDLWARELAYRLPTTAQLFSSLTRRGPAGPKQIFGQALTGLDRLGEEDFEAIWQRALTNGERDLPDRDLELLKGLGTVLGSCGWEDQRSAVERVARQLERRGEALAQALVRERKTWGVLGLSAGCALAILLL